MIVQIVQTALHCDGCGTPFDRGEKYESSAEIRTFAAKAEWKDIKIYNVELDICPACQAGTTRAAGN